MIGSAIVRNLSTSYAWQNQRQKWKVFGTECDTFNQRPSVALVIHNLNSPTQIGDMPIDYLPET